MLKLTTNFASQWIVRVNDLSIIISASIVIAFVLFSTPLAVSTGKELGLEVPLIAAVAGLVSLLFSAVLFRLIVGRHSKVASITGLTLILVAVGSLVVLTGGFESVYLPLWGLLALVVGVYGPLPIALLWLTAGVYFILNQLGFGAIVEPDTWLVNFILLQIPIVGSGLFWHNVESKPQRGTIDILSNSLEDEKRKADIVINAIADGVVVISQSTANNGQITLINPAATEILGWTWEEALNLNYRSIFKLTDEKGKDIEKNDDPFTTVVRTKASVTRNDLVLHTKADSTIDIAMVVSPIRSPEGDVTATIGVFRDVSAERREQKQRSDFISTASHEMRTPVAAIEGYLSLAMNEKVAKVDTKAREYLGKAADSTRHLGKLFQDLLTSAKAEDGRLTSHPKVTNIGEMVEQLADDLRFTAEKKGLLVDLAQQNTKAAGKISPLYYSYVDIERMREVVINIFDNAVKYTEEGRVTIGYTGTADRITITVADTGVGIPQEDIPHLFQKFYRVDNTATRQVGGTGLGLFITKKIVELYNGRIWVESTVGEGSIFYISLPRLTNEKAQEMIRVEAATVTPLSGVTGV